MRFVSRALLVNTRLLPAQVTQRAWIVRWASIVPQVVNHPAPSVPLALQAPIRRLLEQATPRAHLVVLARGPALHPDRQTLAPAAP